VKPERYVRTASEPCSIGRIPPHGEQEDSDTEEKNQSQNCIFRLLGVLTKGRNQQPDDDSGD
jgi:hypothetical protein